MTGGWAITIALAVSGLSLSDTSADPKGFARGTAEGARIVDGPVVESATDRSVIIRWTTEGAAGPVVHYGVVHYGTDPKKFTETAKSPNRWNRNLPQMTYRVRVSGLKAATTYYYTVESVPGENAGAGVKSVMSQFVTGRRP